jgi:hypothetical protein
VEALFAFNDGESDKAHLTNTDGRSKLQKKVFYRFQFGVFWKLKLNLISWLCCKALCFDKQDRLADKALGRVRQEMNIAEWLQFMRVTKVVLQRMHTKRQWQNLLKKYRLAPVTLHSNDDEEPNVFKPSTPKTPATARVLSSLRSTKTVSFLEMSSHNTAFQRFNTV